jgi:hypothetical protein
MVNIISLNRWGTTEERFERAVRRQGECLIWTAGKNTMGYGLITTPDGVKVVTHRYSYERAMGPIPEGLSLDHICHNKACVEPKHLRLVTQKQNQEHLRGPNSRSTTGVRGVQIVKPRGKNGGAIRYRAKVGHNRRSYDAGTYATIAEAEAAAIALRLQLFTHNDLDRKAAA